MKEPDQLQFQKLAFPDPRQELVQPIVEALSAVQKAPPELDPSTSGPAYVSKALVTISNQAWRMKVATSDPESKEAKSELTSQELRKVVAAIEAIWEAIGSLGIRVIDRNGDPFNPGLPDQVVSEEPREGISEEVIIRTIRPTIIWDQVMVQRGEIDIAVPLRKTEATQPSL